MMVNLIRRYLTKRNALFFVLAPMAMFLEVFMDLLQPSFMESIIDIGIASRDLNFVYMTGMKMVLAAVIGLVGGISCGIFASNGAIDVATKLREGIFAKIQKFSFVELDRFKTSSLITRLTSDVNQVQMMMLMALRGMVRAPLLCIGGIVMALSSSMALSTVFLLSLPLILMATFVVLGRSFNLFVALQNQLDNLNRTLRENILGVRVIKALNLQAIEKEEFERDNEALMAKSIAAQNMNMILWPIVTLIMNLSVVAVLWFGGGMVIAGSLPVGKIMAFVNYLIQIMNALIMVVTIVVNFSKAQASTQRIAQVLDCPIAIEQESDAVAVGSFDIEFQDVSFSYGDQAQSVLSHIDLSIPQGTKVGLIGPTGSGKSTLTYLLGRLYDVASGKILIGGCDVRQLELASLRDHLGYVLQDSLLFSGTIEENLKYGNEAAGEQLVGEMMEIARIGDFVDSQEKGRDSIVFQRGTNFSGGQKQRLSIARTLIKQPDILILDDATSALDLATEAALQKQLFASFPEATIIQVAQRISSIRDMDLIVVIDNGVIQGQGSHETLMENCRLYQEIAQSQNIGGGTNG